MTLIRAMNNIQVAEITKQPLSRLAAGDKSSAKTDKIEAKHAATTSMVNNIIKHGSAMTVLLESTLLTGSVNL